MLKTMGSATMSVTILKAVIFALVNMDTYYILMTSLVWASNVLYNL